MARQIWGKTVLWAMERGKERERKIQRRRKGAMNFLRKDHKHSSKAKGPTASLLTHPKCGMKRLAGQLCYSMDKVSQSTSAQQKRLLCYVMLHNYAGTVTCVNALEESLFSSFGLHCSGKSCS